MLTESEQPEEGISGLGSGFTAGYTGCPGNKAHPDQLDQDLLEIPGYHITWASAERKGYSGVALFSKEEPLSVQIGLGIEKFDREGRTIIADYGDYVLLSAYFPNGSRDHSRVPFKMEYYDAFLETCENLRAQGRSVIFCGDVNTAHQEIDLARPKQNVKTTGFLPEERAWLDKVVEAGYSDIFGISILMRLTFTAGGHIGETPGIRMLAGALITFSFRPIFADGLLMRKFTWMYKGQITAPSASPLIERLRIFQRLLKQP